VQDEHLLAPQSQGPKEVYDEFPAEFSSGELVAISGKMFLSFGQWTILRFS
jgi:hypothetical protein